MPRKLKTYISSCQKISVRSSHVAPGTPRNRRRRSRSASIAPSVCRVNQGVALPDGEDRVRPRRGSGGLHDNGLGGGEAQQRDGQQGHRAGRSLNEASLLHGGPLWASPTHGNRRFVRRRPAPRVAPVHPA